MAIGPEWNTSDEIVRDIPAIGRLRDYWESLNNGRPPERNLIDPKAITDLLPYMLLVDFESEPFRIRYRLTGTKVDETTGYNITGRYLDEFLREPFGALKEGIVQLHHAYEQAWRTGESLIGAYEWSPSPLPLKMPFGIFPVAIQGEIVQAIGIERPYRSAPTEEIKTWKECLAIHASGHASGGHSERDRTGHW